MHFDPSAIPFVLAGVLAILSFFAAILAIAEIERRWNDWRDERFWRSRRHRYLSDE